RQSCFFFNDTATTEIYTLSLHDALPICLNSHGVPWTPLFIAVGLPLILTLRSEEHTSELQSHSDLVCRLLLEKKLTGWETFHIQVQVLVRLNLACVLPYN